MRCAIVDVLDGSKALVGTYAISLGGDGFTREEFEREALRCAIEDGLPRERAHECTFVVRSEDDPASV